MGAFEIPFGAEVENDPLMRTGKSDTHAIFYKAITQFTISSTPQYISLIRIRDDVVPEKQP
jgi:hypothetical protein